jgi:YD repeat-containing protein
MYVADGGNDRVEVWAPDAQAAHDTKTIYYTKTANTEYPSCGGHVEWENLPCETLPAAQPEDKISVPITTTTYNMWGEPETITETFGSTTRTRKMTYDAAGRNLTNEVTATADKALPKVTNEYNTETGALVKQSTTSGEETKTVTSVFNTLGELEKYTDADGDTTSYLYNVDGSVEEMSYKINGETYKQTYAYSPSTGELTKLQDSTADTFTASYDPEGKLLTQGYPNGMTATYTYNPSGEATNLEYEKTTHCTEKCILFSDSIIPSIHGEVMSQTSTLAKETYAYDSDGRLTEEQETPTGQGCKTRIYVYDEESNRTSQTSREPTTENKCATEGGTTERHIYDEANRLTDEGVEYDTLGNTTKLPAGDAGGHELTSTYYTDSQLATQTQNGKTIEYSYDPAGRTRKTTTNSKTTMITHYPGPGEAIAWTSETTEGTEKWSRDIPGIAGELTATQNNGEQPILQLHDLNGNIIGTASLNETETKLSNTYNSSTFGVPTTTSPPKYTWLGATGITSELPNTGITNKAGMSYVPQVARELQTIPIVAPGALPNGSGPGQAYTAQVAPPGLETALMAQAEQIYAEVKSSEQKVAEEETEKALKRCREEGGCEASAPRSTQGGAGEASIFGDPEVYLSAGEAKGFAYAIRYGASLVGVIASALLPEVDVFLEALEIVGDNALSEAAEKLERCYQPLYESHNTASGKCKVFVDLVAGFIPSYWGVELCWKKEYKRKNSIHVTYRYCEPS